MPPGFLLPSSLIGCLEKLNSACASSCQRQPSGPSLLCLKAPCWAILEVSWCCHRLQLWTCCFLSLLRLLGYLIYAEIFLYQSTPLQYLSESVPPLSVPLQLLWRPQLSSQQLQESLRYPQMRLWQTMWANSSILQSYLRSVSWLHPIQLKAP